MRNFKGLDPQSLKAFYFAAETLNFTRASELAALTQSGVSQHIAKLEDELGVSLFVRSGRRVLLSEAGKELRLYVEAYIDRLDELLESISAESRELTGLVRYAMPNACLYTPHFPLLLDKRAEFRNIELKVTICHSEKVIEMLRGGEIDFGFVTKAISGTDIDSRVFAHEEYVLLSSTKSSLTGLSSPDDLAQASFVSYPGVDVFLSHWQNKAYPKKKPIDLNQANIKGEINSISGALTMVEKGVGITIAPKHCALSSIKSGQLYFRSVPNCRNPVSIVNLALAKQPARVKRVLDAFWEMS